ncbi:serine/arginine repetitive matrix protein 1-like [Triticum urartu]|uniref:serine/arginine repetitive matrix protein 1-like n=1 Tax=Triticum urartu TaxID=4572 RepID=UPI002043E3E1|nr:serine/arginine repetitive matrix protein 1-like [Triticum urartu]
MADGDQNQQPPRYWFPYWSPVRPQLSRRLSPPSSPAVPSSPRRPSPSHPRQPTPPRAAHSQASSRPSPSPSPSRASPLAPIREPPNSNSNAGATARPPPKPVALPATPKPKDVDVVPQTEKAAVHPTPAAAETKHGKAAQHHHKEKEADKDEHKSKDKKHHAGEDGKHKDKEKKHHADAGEESKHKEKKHHADAGDEGKHKGKEKEAKAEHGKLHGELKADMVRRATGSGHGQGASVITLAGENKGASMKVGGKGKDGSWKEHHGGHRLDGKPVDGQKKQGMMTALINSNVQVINNSLLLHSSCNGGDPGVHLKLSAKSANKDKQKHAAAKK